jgi:hypothetical protein
VPGAIIPGLEEDQMSDSTENDEEACGWLCWRMRQRVVPNGPLAPPGNKFPIEYFIINLMKMRHTNITATDEKD